MLKQATQEIFVPQAPGRNMSAVMREALIPGSDICGGTGKPLSERFVQDALEKLIRFRREYAASKDVPVEEIAYWNVGSREELIKRTGALFDEFAVPQAEDEERMRHASHAGCAEVMAFIELTAGLHAERGVEPVDNDEYKRLIGRSVITLLKIAATSREADGAVAANASMWSMRDIRVKKDEELYLNLKFDSSCFDIIDNVVVLKQDSRTRKRLGRRRGRRFDFSPSKTDVLFGCPFRSRIARLHSAMLDAALRNDLLKRVEVSQLH